MEVNTPELEELRARISKLEKRSATWRLWIFIPLLIIILADLLVSLQSSGLGRASISTRNLVIKDDAGRNRIFMNYKHDSGGLVIVDEQGNPQFGLTVGDDGKSSLSVGSLNGTSRAVIGVNEDSTAFFALSGVERKIVSSFYVSTGDSTKMSLRDADDRTILAVP